MFSPENNSEYISAILAGVVFNPSLLESSPIAAIIEAIALDILSLSIIRFHYTGLNHQLIVFNTSKFIFVVVNCKHRLKSSFVFYL